MTDPNEYNIPTDAVSRDAVFDSGRFEAFTEKERQLLSDALHGRFATVRQAFEVCKVELPEHFKEEDFGIPTIRAMLDELEGPEGEDETQKQG